MKYTRVIELFAVPTILTALSFNALHTLGDTFNLFADGVNYLPLLCSLSFFAFLFFFVTVANILYPANVVVLPIKKDAVPVQPSYFQVVRYTNTVTPKAIKSIVYA